VWNRFSQKPRNLLGLAVALALGTLALFADFIANDRPILLHQAGKLSLFPDLSGPRALPAATAGRGDWALWAPFRHGPYTIPALAARVGPLPEPPSADHPLGTDNAGRDTLARLVHGARASLGVGIAAALVQVSLGLALGVLAGYLGGWVDFAVTRVAEVLLSFPLLLLLLVVQGVLERTTLVSTMAVIALTRWADTSRLVRAEALRVREMPYVEASRALGSPRWRTLVMHVLPNCLSPALVAATFGVGSAILLESALSFLGVGVQPPTPSWGNMIQEGMAFYGVAWWMSLFPGLAILVTVVSYNLVGEALRDALDPALRRGAA